MALNALFDIGTKAGAPGCAAAAGPASSPTSSLEQEDFRAGWQALLAALPADLSSPFREQAPNTAGPSPQSESVSDAYATPPAQPVVAPGTPETHRAHILHGAAIANPASQQPVHAHPAFNRPLDAPPRCTAQVLPGPQKCAGRTVMPAGLWSAVSAKIGAPASRSQRASEIPLPAWATLEAAGKPQSPEKRADAPHATSHAEDVLQSMTSAMLPTALPGAPLQVLALPNAKIDSTSARQPALPAQSPIAARLAAPLLETSMTTPSPTGHALGDEQAGPVQGHDAPTISGRVPATAQHDAQAHDATIGSAALPASSDRGMSAADQARPITTPRSAPQATSPIPRAFAAAENPAGMGQQPNVPRVDPAPAVRPAQVQPAASSETTFAHAAPQHLSNDLRGTGQINGEQSSSPLPSRAGNEPANQPFAGQSADSSRLSGAGNQMKQQPPSMPLAGGADAAPSRMPVAQGAVSPLDFDTRTREAQQPPSTWRAASSVVPVRTPVGPSSTPMGPGSTSAGPSSSPVADSDTSRGAAPQPPSTAHVEADRVQTDRTLVAPGIAVQADPAPNLDAAAPPPPDPHVKAEVKTEIEADVKADIKADVKATRVPTNPSAAFPGVSLTSDPLPDAGDTPHISASLPNTAPADLDVSRVPAPAPHVPAATAKHEDAAPASIHFQAPSVLPEPEPAHELPDSDPLTRPSIGFPAPQAPASPRPADTSASIAVSSAPVQGRRPDERPTHTATVQSSESSRTDASDKQDRATMPAADSQKTALSAMPATRPSTPSAAVHAAEPARFAQAVSHSAAADGTAAVPSALPTAAPAISPDVRDRVTDAGHRAAAAPPADAFAALDTAVSTPSATWVHTGTHQAEAGYFDPSLGWVGVRAQSSGGAIHAAIVPGTAQAAQDLGAHVAGLNSYFAEHHSGFLHVTMTAPGHGDGGVTAGGQSGARHQQQPPETPLPRTSFNRAPAPGTMAAVSSQAQTQWDAGPTTGVHISVLA